MSGPTYGQRRGAGIGLIVALIIAAISIFRYFGSSSVNPTTGEKQRTGGITPRQEIALGLQAAPEMIRQYGGAGGDARGQALVDRVGQQLLAGSDLKNSPYPYQFHLLNDNRTINAFALPGGQVFITRALLQRLKTEGQVAGVLGHEMAHVAGRHSAEQLAKQQLTQGLTGAAVMASYDPENPNSRNTAAVAAAIGQLVNLKFSRNDEVESDRLGVRFMSQAGYDPRGMIGVMQVLKAAAGGGRTPEFFATHPNPENRIPRIEEAIREQFPEGVPNGLRK
ncbi:MAG: M48 family metallopeptidase [Capsulimonadales bacterium]|nr:M48 family metallopeptidase [Capsulimonadales bacterium]